MRYLFTVLVLIAITVATPPPTLAWNRSGHMTSGALAFLELKNSDPQTLQKVIALLKEHPFYRSRWLPAIRRQVGMRNHDLYLFMYAARWADDIRGTEWHCGDCHFINYAFKPVGQPASVPTPDPRPVNVEQAFEEKRRIVQDRNSAPADKALALVWVFHLIGDVHQPLHTTALFTTQFPTGDLGGNLFFVRRRAGQDTTNLHSLWDGLVIQSEAFQAVSDKARALRARTAHQRAALSELAERDFHDWSKEESFVAARIHAYQSGFLKAGSKENGEVLPVGYLSVAVPLAERRMALAGYRLADTLKELVN